MALQLNNTDGYVYDVVEYDSPGSPGGKLTQSVNKGWPTKLVLSVDKPTITADGTDTATITAKVYDYQDNFLSTDTRTITFDLNGTTQEVAAAAGEASIPFDTTVADTYTITASADKTNGASVEVTAQ